MGPAARLACGLLLASLSTAYGCRGPVSQFELVSYRDPYFPETYQVLPDDCTFRVDLRGEHDIVARATRTTEGGEPITQFLHVHLFWQPKPGRTFADPSCTDATIRYVVTHSTGTAEYAGTGFVYPRRRWWSRGLTLAIESANLRPESQSGTLPEVLGNARLRGKLIAREDAGTTVDLMRRIEAQPKAPSAIEPRP